MNDRGTCILFNSGCTLTAELQFTQDFGNVLLVNPNCLVLRNPRYWSSVEIVRPEYRKDFDLILKKWPVDRFTIKKFS